MAICPSYEFSHCVFVVAKYVCGAANTYLVLPMTHTELKPLQLQATVSKSKRSENKNPYKIMF
jgi:hypothetical protein